MNTKPRSENYNLHKGITQWGSSYLSSHDYELKSVSPEEVKNTPWSYVARFSTSRGYVYLKHTPNLLALEATITTILRDQFHAPVPVIIAQNDELHCFLMNDAGRPLREILKTKFDTDLACNAINLFTLMQLSVSDQVNHFFDIGVPDWRLEKFPDLYMQLLSQKELLMEDGLTESEIGQLKALLPTVSSLCKRLDDYHIKQSIVQCDFHDNNILIDDASQNITLIDLGEIVISHPFFSLVGCLRQMKRHHGLTDDDDNYHQIKDACINNYMEFDSKSHLLDAISTADILWHVYESLAQHRLMIACGKDSLMSFQHGKLSGRLKEFMAAVSINQLL